MAQDSEAKLIEYMRLCLINKLFNPESPARNPELRKVIEAGGEKPGSDHGLSIALSAWFDSEENAHQWNDNILLPALADFPQKFGNQALFFVTLLENIPV